METDIKLNELMTKVSEVNNIDTLRKLNTHVVDKINFIRKMENSKKKFEFSVNNKVKMTKEALKRSGKLTGRIGKILKINKVRCKVDFDMVGIFNVPFSLLEKI